MKITCAYTELVNIDSLIPHPKNKYHKHPAEQIKRLAKLIEYQGFRHPIIVSKQSGYIVAGHGRFSAAKLLKMHQVPVDYQGFESEDAEYAFLVSDNAISLWPEIDLTEINSDIPELSPDFNFEMLGLKDFGLDPKAKKPKEITCPNCGEIFGK